MNAATAPKRHVYIFNECPEITHPVVRAVHYFVADAVAGFIGDTFPGAELRKRTATNLREWRRKNFAEVRGILRLDYLPESRVSARLRYYRAAAKRSRDQFVRSDWTGKRHAAAMAEIIAEVAKL